MKEKTALAFLALAERYVLAVEAIVQVQKHASWIAERAVAANEKTARACEAVATHKDVHPEDALRGRKEGDR